MHDAIADLRAQQGELASGVAGARVDATVDTDPATTRPDAEAVVRLVRTSG